MSPGCVLQLWIFYFYFFGRRLDSINCLLVPTSNTPPPPPSCVLMDSRDWGRTEPDGMKSQPPFGLRGGCCTADLVVSRLVWEGKAIAPAPLWRGLGECAGRVGRGGAELGGTIELSSSFCVSAASPAPSIPLPLPGGAGGEERSGWGTPSRARSPALVAAGLSL